MQTTPARAATNTAGIDSDSPPTSRSSSASRAASKYGGPLVSLRGGRVRLSRLTTRKLERARLLLMQLQELLPEGREQDEAWGAAESIRIVQEGLR